MTKPSTVSAGHAKGDLFVVQPRQVSAVYREKDKVHSVHSSDAAIVVATTQVNA